MVIRANNTVSVAITNYSFLGGFTEPTLGSSPYSYYFIISYYFYYSSSSFSEFSSTSSSSEDSESSTYYPAS